MKKKLLFALSFGAAIVLLAGCGSAPQKAEEAPQMKEEYVSENVEGVLVDSKTKAFGVPMPDWVSNYTVKGRRTVERMSDYTDATVFIGEETGTNLQALKAWGNNFSANFLISSTLKTEFESIANGAGAGSTGSTVSGAPPANFENYMENVLEMTTNATYSGARKEADWWGKYRHYKSDGKTVDREEYRFYILVSMEKALFESQLNKMLSDAASATYANTPERNRAIDLVRNSWNSLP